MGAKRTSELIPLCHPLPLDDCKVEIEARLPGADGSVEVEVRCRARTAARTGVEMEALTGASVAALALYDMGKAVTHGIVIRDPAPREDRREEGLPRNVKKTVSVSYFAILREERGSAASRSPPRSQRPVNSTRSSGGAMGSRLRRGACGLRSTTSLNPGPPS
jgi:hypothetical protein